MLTVTQCPVCTGKKFSPHLNCTDYTVSHETFSILRCKSCGLLVTSPRPSDTDLSRYYLSEKYISHSNKSTSVIDKVYKRARQRAINWKTHLLYGNIATSGIAKPRLLDVGCGTGEFLNNAQMRGWHITGVEPSSIARTQASALTGAQIFEHIDDVHGEFDAITLWHVLEHIPDLNAALEKLKLRLSKTGMIFIAVPNPQSADAKNYKALWAGYDVPRHLWHFSQSTMKQLLTNHSLTVKKIIPMKLDAFYVSLLSEKYKRRKNSLVGIIRAFLNGLNSNRKATETTEYSSLIYLAKK